MSTDGVDMGYNADDLRGGGQTSADTVALAEETMSILRGAAPPAATDFGEVAGATALAAAISRARDIHSRVAQAAHQRHMDLQANADRTAAAGERLIDDSSGIAGGTG